MPKPTDPKAGRAGSPGPDDAEGNFTPVPIGRNGDSPHHVYDPPPRRRRSPLLTFGLILTLAAVVATPLAFAIVFVFHLGPFANNGFPVKVHNDTGAATVIRRCGSNCTSLYQSVDLAPGESVDVGATDDGAMIRYYLHDTTGTVTGCLPLTFTRKLTGFLVQISQAVPCPGSNIASLIGPAPSGTAGG